MKSSFRRDAEPARETRALPNHRLGALGLGGGLGAASVSCGVSEWGLVWVSVLDCLKRWLWRLASESLCRRTHKWRGRRSCRGCRSRCRA